MKHTIKLLTLAFMLATILTLTGCPGPVNNYIDSPVWDDGVVTTEPTCTEEGVKTYTCSNGETRTESIPIDPNNHNFGEWSNWRETRSVTYNHDGEKEHTHTCTRCGHSETEKVTVSRFVAGGYDGTIPTDVENPETYRYQYADGIKFHLYVTTQEKFDNRTRSSDIWNDYYLSFNASNLDELVERYEDLFEKVILDEGDEKCKIHVNKLLSLKSINNNFNWYFEEPNTLNTTYSQSKDDTCRLGKNIKKYYIVTTN